MGNIFSENTSTPISDNYAKQTQLSDYAKQTQLLDYAKKTQLSDYAKTTDISKFIDKDVNDLTNYYTTGKVDEKISSIKTNIDTLQTGNYLAYTDSNKNAMNLSGDYLTFQNSSNQPLIRFNKYGTMNINTTNSVPFTFNSPGQTHSLGLQSGNDGNDFIRIGQVILNDNGTVKNQKPFIRMDVSSNDTDPELPSRRVLIRAPTIALNGKINIGSDNDTQYYQIYRQSNFPVDPCLYMNYIDTTVTPNINKQVGKWCPQDGIVPKTTTT